MQKISAVIITLNEEAVIEQTLQSLVWCDEIVVVDSGSTDRTVAICEHYGCRVIYRPFDGYGTQKNFAVGCALHDWVFVVDADEVITPSLASEIKSCLALPQIPFRGFRVPRSFIFMGKLIRFGGEYGKAHLRLFNKQFGNYNTAEVHENVDIEGSIGLLRNHMLHYSYRNIEDYFHKFNKYTSAGANELYKRKKKVSKAYIFIRFPFSFLQLYLFKGLILDGYPGFVWALFSAMYPVVKYVKLKELYDKGV